MNLRQVYNNQPALHLVIDLNHPMTNETLHRILQASQNVLALSVHLRGKSRIQYFALSTIEETFRNIVPLQSLKENVGRVLSILEDFKDDASIRKQSAQNCDRMISQAEFQLVLRKCIEAAIDIFQSSNKKSTNAKTLGTDKNLTSSTEQQVCFMTSKVHFNYQHFVEDTFTLLSSSSIKKLQVVELISKDVFEGKTMYPARFFEFLQIHEDLISLEDFFKTWMNDSERNKEHLRIQFFSSGLNSTTLHCDISESVLNPVDMPFTNQFVLQTNATHLLKDLNNSEVPIYELNVLGRVPKSSVVDRFCFGQPLILRPTQCWQFEWQQIVDNEHFFIGLNQFLHMNQEFLLCQRKREKNLPAGYFILNSGGEELSMLLRPLAPRELILAPPAQGKTDSDPIPSITKHIVSAEMKRTPFLHDFNPKLLQSGFYDVLIQSTLSNFLDSETIFRFPNEIRKKLRGDVPKFSENTSEEKGESNAEKSTEVTPRTTLEIFGAANLAKKNGAVSKATRVPESAEVFRFPLPNETVYETPKKCFTVKNKVAKSLGQPNGNFGKVNLKNSSRGVLSSKPATRKKSNLSLKQLKLHMFFNRA